MIGKMHQMCMHYAVRTDLLYSQVHILFPSFVYFVFHTRASSDERNTVLPVWFFNSALYTGEQICILACLSAYKQDTETITPFKVAAVMSKNGKWHSPKKQNGNMDDETNSTNGETHSTDQNGENLLCEKFDPSEDVSASESLLRMEDHRRQTETLLQRFENSHFFVRIAESSDPLWSKKGSTDKQSDCETVGQNTVKSSINAVIDQGDFNSNVSGGVARGTFKCCSLSDGSIVVCIKKLLEFSCKVLCPSVFLEPTPSAGSKNF